MKNIFKVIIVIIIFILICLLQVVIFKKFVFEDKTNYFSIAQNNLKNNSKDNTLVIENITNGSNLENTIIDIKPLIKTEKEPKEIDDWRLVLVNYENSLPEGFEPQLANIDKTRQFDSRAIDDLNQMLIEIKKAGIDDLWVQSAYRSVEYQEKIFSDKIKEYLKYGATEDQAEELTLRAINKPGTSEHNLGLSVDFNYVDYSFDESKGFIWLVENAENFGFVLRYKKEKEEITKVDYEPWHWRYVGTDNAKKMNELDMCLEEYIEYLKYN